MFEQLVFIESSIKEAFRLILRASGGRYLLHFERQGARAYWGGAVDKVSGEVLGRNRLGEMLMELRAELLAAHDEDDEDEDRTASKAKASKAKASKAKAKASTNEEEDEEGERATSSAKSSSSADAADAPWG